MNALRLVVGEVAIIAVLVILVLMGNASLGIYLDPIGLAAIVTLPWISVLATRGARGVFKGDREWLVRSLIRRTWLVAVILSLIGPVAMLSNLVNDTPSLPGPGFALALLPLLYAALVHLLVLEPALERAQEIA